MYLFFFFSCNEEISVTPPDAKPQAGYIFVTSKPTGAAIYLNGLNTGRVTPDSIDWLDSGDYNILLRLKGWKDTLITTHLNKDEKRSFNIDFTVSSSMLGAIYCTSEPEGADVFFNDSSTGKVTPMLISGLLPGKYKIFLNKTNYLDDSIYVDVESQKITEAKIVMTDTMEMVVYNTKNSGIPSNSVLCIAVDKNNIKWIGTDGEGLAAFDGNTFTSFNRKNTPIQDNRISSIYVDEQNNKWIGTTSGGLVKFDGITWTVYDNSINPELPDNLIIQKVTGDKNGMIWIGTFGQGLIVFDGTKFTIFNEQNTGMPLSAVNDIAIDGNGTVWAALFGGIAKFENNVWKLYGEDDSEIPFSAIALTVNYNNDIIAAFQLIDRDIMRGKNNCMYFSLTENSWRKVENIYLDTLTTLFKAKNNYIWIGSTKGFQLIDRYRGRTIWNKNNSSLPDNFISAMAVDNTNYPYWVCTQNGGLVKFKKKFN